jgi:DNA-binding protein H-NS
MQQLFPTLGEQMDQYKDLPFDQLRALHREIGALIAQRRHEALEQLRQQASILGFTADDLAPKKQRKNAARRYRDPNNPDNTWTGKGRKPSWLTEAIEAGRSLEEFEVAA